MILEKRKNYFEMMLKIEKNHLYFIKISLKTYLDYYLHWSKIDIFKKKSQRHHK